MDATTFLDNFGAVAEAPGGVDRLRELILRLAVHGGLVSQLANEVPASVELSHVLQSPDWRVRARERGAKRDPRIEGLAGVARIPEGWTECRMEDIVQLLNGRAYGRNELLDEGTPVIRIQNLNGGDSWYYSDLALPPDKMCDAGDLLFAWSASFGPYIWNGPRAIFHYHIWKIHLSPAIRKNYLYFVLQHLTAQVRAQSHGLAMLHMTKARMERWPILLPPIAEQDQIVANVNELMRLCDELETRQQTRYHITTRLRASSLDALTNAGTDDDLRTAWSRIHNNWDALVESEEGIDHLRQAALLMAVKGRLIRQGSEDQDAAASIRRAETELEGQAAVRGRGASRERIAGRGALSVGEPSATYLPAGWAVAPLSSITRLESGHTPDRKISEYWDGPFPWIGIRDARKFRNGTVFETEDTVSLDGINNSAARLLPAGTVCLSRTASVGYAVVMGREMCTSQDFVNFLCTSALQPSYLQLIFRAEGDALRRFSKGAVHQTIYFPEVKAFHVLLPPRAEQERILAKVDELMKTCDELAARFTLRDTTQARAATSICAHAKAS